MRFYQTLDDWGVNVSYDSLKQKLSGKDIWYLSGEYPNIKKICKGTFIDIENRRKSEESRYRTEIDVKAEDGEIIHPREFCESLEEAKEWLKEYDEMVHARIEESKRSDYEDLPAIGQQVWWIRNRWWHRTGAFNLHTGTVAEIWKRYWIIRTPEMDIKIHDSYFDTVYYDFKEAASKLKMLIDSPKKNYELTDKMFMFDIYRRLPLMLIALVMLIGIICLPMGILGKLALILFMCLMNKYISARIDCGLEDYKETLFKELGIPIRNHVLDWYDWPLERDSIAEISKKKYEEQNKTEVSTGI